MPSTLMEEHEGNSNNDVEDIHDNATRYMASSSNRACVGANDASLLEYADYDIYDGYENDTSGLTEEQLTLSDSFNITLRDIRLFPFL
nr:hypothetical protein [Tanacetum cinerariifolium]